MQWPDDRVSISFWTVISPEVAVQRVPIAEGGPDVGALFLDHLPLLGLGLGPTNLLD